MQQVNRLKEKIVSDFSKEDFHLIDLEKGNLKNGHGNVSTYWFYHIEVIYPGYLGYLG